MHINRKRGSLIVDAACCIPILIIAAVTLLYLILQCGIEETVAHTLVQSARSSTRAVAVLPSEDPQGIRFQGIFTAVWEGMVLAEWGVDHPDTSLQVLEVEDTVILPGGSISVDHIARACVSIENVIHIGPSMAKNPKSFKNVVFRPFVGESLQAGAYDAVHVYVFPKRGERYHIRSCSILQDGQIQAILTEKIRKAYTPCKLCHPETLPNGAQICLFSSESRIYHRHSCSSVTKNFVCIPRSEAIAAGYTPCRICGGGHP